MSPKDTIAIELICDRGTTLKRLSKFDNEDLINDFERYLGLKFDCVFFFWLDHGLIEIFLEVPFS